MSKYSQSAAQKSSRWSVDHASSDWYPGSRRALPFATSHAAKRATRDSTSASGDGVQTGSASGGAITRHVAVAGAGQKRIAQFADPVDRADQGGARAEVAL